MARELDAPEDLLRPRDREPLIIVPPQTWHCMFCDPRGPDGARTTVIWLGPNTDGPHGRCTECGQKYALAALYGMLLREALPPRGVESRLDHCVFCQPAAAPGSKPTIAWRGQRGRCARCGQSYTRIELLEAIPAAVFDVCTCAHSQGEHAPGRCRSCEECDGFTAAERS